MCASMHIKHRETKVKHITFLSHLLGRHFVYGGAERKAFLIDFLCVAISNPDESNSVLCVTVERA